MKRLLAAAILQTICDAFVRADETANGAAAVAPMVPIGPAPAADAPVPVVAFIPQAATNAALEAAIYRFPFVVCVTI